MRARDRKRHQVGRFWLYQRPDTKFWSICWLEPKSASNPGGAVTRRKAINVSGGTANRPPQEALDALAAHHIEAQTPQQAKPAEALVEHLMAEWLKLHVSTLAAPRRYADSAVLWSEFFAQEQRAGRLAPAVTVSTISPHLVQRFIAWRRAAGVGGHGISRDLAALRGALNWARKNQLVETVPFIADVPAREKPRSRERVLSLQEVASIINVCAGVPEREHVLRYIIIALGTAGRPEAILELHDYNIDLKHGFIDPNHPGRIHDRKRRVIVPLSRYVRPWVQETGKIIKYRAPIAPKNQIEGGPTHFEKDTASIKTAWNKICSDLGILGATPKTLRHTTLTWLAYQGVPKEQRSMIAGHVPSDTTSKYEHLTPDYLADAMAAIDRYFDALRQHLRGDLLPKATLHATVDLTAAPSANPS
jgi:integrase